MKVILSETKLREQLLDQFLHCHAVAIRQGHRLVLSPL